MSGFIYNVGAQSVPVESDIVFDTNGILSAGIMHIPGSAQIVVSNFGSYEVDYCLSGVEPCQFALFLNSTLATGTIYGSGAGTQQNSGQAIIAAAAGDVLTLRNHSSSSVITLQILAGGTQTSVNASLLIKKLS
ncbi:triple helix repeat-containing collagen [Paenibacillus wynnii]|uniref:Triple helix repeat-containing collagen n=1 Tax=Paenibacillus wynnii TaxID=268407 RepID=A0A098M656_9BACL|nr:triple helix repeat-containing collagen [Paenibacillus wynnii]